MIVPTLEEFRALARSGKLVPIYREVFADLDTPVSAFRKIDDGPYSFLLESVEGGETWGRYSLLGSRPSLVFIARGNRCEIHQGGMVIPCSRHPIEELDDLLRRHQAVALPGLPRFCGGAVGYLGYDGNLDTAITIRSAVLKDGQAHVHTGAGIVAGSVPEREFEETEHKAAALRRAIDMAAGVPDAPPADGEDDSALDVVAAEAGGSGARPGGGS